MNKKNLFLLVSLSFLGILYVIAFYFLTGSHKATEGYLVVSNLGGYSCKARKCTYQEPSKIGTNQKEFRVYHDSQFKDLYELQYTDQWNFFQNGYWVSLYGDFLGVESSLNADVLNYHYEKLNIEDTQAIQQVIKGKVGEYTKLNQNEVLVVDFDQNGVEDRLITVSNQVEEEQNEQYFSVCIAIVNGKVIELFKEFSSEKYDLPFYQILSVFRLDEEKNPRLIVHKYYFDQIGSPSITMEQFTGKNFKTVVSESVLEE